MTTRPVPTPETAVWYFIAATFVFTVGPTLFTPGITFTMTDFLIYGSGILLFILGVVTYFKENRLRREAAQKQTGHSAKS